jgi:hypothetical protein
MSNQAIQRIPIHEIQTNGFLFMWVIKSCYAYALEIMESWGYRFVKTIINSVIQINRQKFVGLLIIFRGLNLLNSIKLQFQTDFIYNMVIVYALLHKKDMYLQIVIKLISFLM